MKKLSIVVPCYNEEEGIKYFYEEILKVSKNLKVRLELIFVNDGSKDKTLEEIKKITSKNDWVKYISFSRNFGKEAAMLAGLKNATGDYLTVMDCDLQDPPELLSKMIYYIEEEGYDIVGTRRVDRKGEPPIRSFFAKCFYKLINKMSKVEMVDGARDYRLMTRQVVDNILELKEVNRYSKGLFSYVGFNTKWLEYENVERKIGKTKWSFWNLFVYAIDGIVAFSTVPLVLSVLIGLLFCLIAFIIFMVIIIKELNNSFISLTCLMMFIGGIQLLCIGIIGEYLAKTYMEIQNRPIYIIKDTNIKEKD